MHFITGLPRSGSTFTGRFNAAKPAFSRQYEQPRGDFILPVY